MVEKVAKKQLDRLRNIPEGSPEGSIQRTYLEWLCDLPWDKRTQDKHDLAAARAVLDADHWAAWTEFQPVLEQQPTGTGAARTVRGLDISHPITDLLGIHSIVVVSIGQPVQGDTGEWTIEIKVKEYRDPEPSQARARGSRNAEADDPVAREIDRLTHQVQELAAPT